MKEFFQNLLNEHTALFKTIEKLFSKCGNGKLILFCLLIASLYPLYKSGWAVKFILLSLLLLGALIGLWVAQSKHKQAMEYHQGIINISKRYLARFDGGWSKFEDTGQEFHQIDHAYGADLDIVGPKSLFQLINLTNTWHGRQALANDLLSPEYTPQQILSRQESVTELSKKPKFSCNFQFYGLKIKAAPLDYILKILSSKERMIDSPALGHLIKLMPILTLVLIATAFILWIRPLFAVAGIFAIIQCALWMLGFNRLNPYLDAVAKAPDIFKHYFHLLELLDKEDFACPHLEQIQAGLCRSQNSALKGIKELSAIIGRTQVKSSGVIYYILNIFLLWDYRCALQVDDWKERYQNHCLNWFSRLGELESLLSLACLVNVCSSAVMPEIRREGRSIEAKALGHPLLHNDIRISNDVSMQEDIFIISGSNMSGKTTFLRTIGINLVLAKSGGPVCAAEMNCSLPQIMSSMRIADDLNQGISTFYAELKRIKAIIDKARQRPDLFFLIDEIFRGTNSEDRLFGANAVIRELSARNVMGIITTHDLSLCDLAQQHLNIKNYSFSESYRDNEMYFEYLLHQGKSNTTNAKFLMEQVGILKK